MENKIYHLISAVNNFLKNNCYINTPPYIVRTIFLQVKEKITYHNTPKNVATRNIVTEMLGQE